MHIHVDTLVNTDTITRHRQSQAKTKIIVSTGTITGINKQSRVQSQAQSQAQPQAQSQAEPQAQSQTQTIVGASTNNREHRHKSERIQE